MERLTYEKSPKGWGRGKYPTKYTSRHTFQEVVARLAAYEDTGLEPEDIDALRKREQGLAELLVQVSCGCAVSYTRLTELAQAEKDGRLGVLPLGKARWIKEILAEREHQDKKWGYPQKNTYCEWASILSEEAGELAQALNELNFGRGSQVQMEMEAVQVAAVALSILETSAVAHVVTTQAAVALGRLTREEAEAAHLKLVDAATDWNQRDWDQISETKEDMK